MIEDFNNLKEDISQYIEVRLEQIKLNLAEITSRIVSRALSSIIVITLIIFILFFLSFSAAFFLGDILNSIHLGFLCISGINFLILLAFIIFRKYIIDRPVIKSVIAMFFPKSSGNEKE